MDHILSLIRGAYSLLPFLYAILGLGLLVFIHEMGHYLVARKVGMRVEAFSIGFGPAIYSWIRGGVVWQIGVLPFGGYVKIAGMEKRGNIEPYQIKDGFFGAKPSNRIKVALAGPLVNIVFAFLCFCLIWSLGGRIRPFSYVTKHVGWVAPSLEKKGLNPGDKISSFGGKPYLGAMDFKYGGVFNDRKKEIIVEKFLTGDKLKISLAEEDLSLQKDTILPASLLFIQKFPHIEASHLATGDRVVFADGVPVFSAKELGDIINEDKSFVSVLREGEEIEKRVPRVSADAIRFFPKEERILEDLRRSTEVDGKYFFLPYFFNEEGIVESFSPYHGPFETIDQELRVGDKVIAVDGTEIKNRKELFVAVQKKHIQLQVKRGEEQNLGFYKKADQQAFNPAIYLDKNLLITSAPLEVVSLNKDRKGLGILFSDAATVYNPGPFTLFNSILDEMRRTLLGLFKGAVSPKGLAGPVGIVGVMKTSWMVGDFKEAIYWLGLISLNLGVLNLLPIPVLDGGHICMSLWEKISGRALSSKAMQKITMPFILLLIGFFLYVTVYDVLRLNLFK